MIVDDDNFVKSFPDNSILTSVDLDQFIKFHDKTSMSIYVKDPKDSYNFLISKLKSVNVHLLNKIAVINNFDKIMETING